LARQLSEQVAAVVEAASRSMPQGSLPQHLERDAAVRRMTSVREAVEQLLPKLAQLQGPDQTKPGFELVQERVAMARKYMRQGKPSPKLRAYWQEANATFVKLARYYGVDAREPGA
jgi:hypothetical protein